MNATNRIYLRLKDYAETTPASLIAPASFKSDIYGEPKEAFTVKVSDVHDSEIESAQIGGEIEVKEVNVVLDVQILVRPDDQTETGRLAAREKSDAAAKELGGYLQHYDFGECFLIGKIKKRNVWVAPGGVRTAASVLRLFINTQ